MSRLTIGRWIAQIGDCSRKGLHKETLNLFHQMQREGLRPSRYVLPSVLRACANLSDIQTGKILHNLITRSLLDSDAFISSALIDMYSKCGQVHHARRVFDGTPDRDLVVWNSMVSGYAHQGLAEDAMALHRGMQSSGPKPDIVTWNALISGFSQAANDEMALELFSLMQLDGVEPDVFSWTSVISGLVRNLHYSRAFGMFKQLVVVAGLQPSSFTISSLLPACANALNLRRGREIHGYALVSGVENDLYVSSSLVDMYAKCGLVFEARKIFDKMRVRNTVSWNSMIFGLANHGYCEDAIALFYRMDDEGVALDHLTFTAVLTASSHAGMIELGRNVFSLMQEVHGIKPRMEHYACMVDLLGRAGMVDEAYDLIKGMPMKPDSFVWGALLGACRNHGNFVLAEEAASYLFELEPESVGSRVLLSNVLVDAGRWSDACRIMKVMKKQKLKRFTGCSWMQAT